MKTISRYLLLTFSVSASLVGGGVVRANNWICTGTDNWDNTNCWDPQSVPAAGETAFLIQDSSADIIVNYSLLPPDPLLLGEIRLDATGDGTITLQMNGDPQSPPSLSATSLIIARNGSGRVVQSNGTSVFTNAFLGSSSMGSGAYELSGLDSSVTFEGLTVGNLGFGSFTQSAGHTVVNSTLGEPTLVIGAEAGGSGTYTLSGGDLTVGDQAIRNGVVEVGRWGTGSFIQEAGTVHTVNGDLVLGRKAGEIGAPEAGTYTMNGGSLTADQIIVGEIPPVLSNIPNVFPDVHEASDGRFIQNDGTVDVANSLTISVSGGARGLYELRGGGLTTTNLINNDRFEYSGGELSGNIENHASLSFSGDGTRVVHGHVANIGETLYQQYNEALTPPLLVFEETKNGLISLADGTQIQIGLDLTLVGDSGTLAIELGSTFFALDAANPWISVDGTASLDGVLDLTDITGWSPVDGDSWLLIDSAVVDGEFLNVLYPVIPNWDWQLVYGSDFVSLTGNVSAVPIPTAVWLFGSGLIGLVGVARRGRYT